MSQGRDIEVFSVVIKILTLGASLGWFSGVKGRGHLKPSLAHFSGQEEAEGRSKA